MLARNEDWAASTPIKLPTIISRTREIACDDFSNDYAVGIGWEAPLVLVYKRRRDYLQYFVLKQLPDFLST